MKKADLLADLNNHSIADLARFYKLGQLLKLPVVN